MNILILFSQPWKVGGAETHVEALIKGLQEHKIFLAINSGSHNDKLQAMKLKYPHVTIVEIQTRGINPFKWWRDLDKLTKLIRQQNIDIISAQQRTAGLWAYRMHRTTGVPFTVTMHDSWHRAQGKSLYARLFPRMIIVGQHLYKRLIYDFGFMPEQIACIHNGVDFSVFVPQDKQDARRQLGLSYDDVLLLHASRLSTIKGAVAMSLLHSINEILNRIPNIKLAIIGEGPLRPQLEEMVRKINNQYDREIVKVYNFTDKIITWYNAADVVIGEGRVAIEALACQKPVVAIRNGQYFLGTITTDNLAEAITVNFDGNNKAVTAQTLAHEIQTGMLMDTNQCKDIANSIVSQLSIEHMAREYLAVFVSISKGE